MKNELSLYLNFTSPYGSESKGKVELLFRNMDKKFISELTTNKEAKNSNSQYSDSLSEDNVMKLLRVEIERE